jgi:hypothetical protein
MSPRTIALSLAAVTALSVPAKADVGGALDAALDAADVNDATESRCQSKLAVKLDAVIDALRAAKRNPTERAVNGAKRKVKTAADLAEDRCPDRVGQPIVAKLDLVLDELDDAVGADDNAGSGGGGGMSAKIGPIKVGNGMFDGRPVVELNPRNISATGLKGRNVYFAMGVAPKGDNQYEWSSLAPAQVMYDPVEWKDAGVFRFYNDWLSEHDTANGKWTGLFVIYDADSNSELFRKEISFTFKAEDVVMDADSYNALVDALRGSTTDFDRLDLLTAQIANVQINSKQLGPILDTFTNELIRLDAARAAVPRVVNKTVALVHANKFRNSLLADDYRALCQ